MSVTPSLSGAGLNKEAEEEILKDLCFSNGVNVGKIEQAGPETTKLEMFFSGFPRIVGMENFPNLTSLILMGQPIYRIEGISYLTKLKELWLCDSNVLEIQGLEKCWQLKKLYLYGNQIKKIKNLDTLTEIEYLWLNNNNISKIENLTAQKKLKELNIAGNRIEKIGFALDSHQSLESLNLSANKIFSLKEISQLVRLPFLKILGLKDPLYGPCPVCLLCNYTTHVLYHLPMLMRLDGLDVSNKTLRELAEATVDKKKMFYNMRVNAIKQKSTEVLDKLRDCKDDMVKVPDEKIAALNYALKEVKRDLNEMKKNDGLDTSHDSDTESDKDAKVIRAEEDRSIMNQLRQKRDVVKDRLKLWEKRMGDLNKFHQEAEDRIRNASNVNIQRLTYELESGGNLRFEDGTSADPWFTSCHDLVLSRFCAADFKELGVVGIKIHRITRVHNRVLRMRFDDRVALIQDDDDVSSDSSKGSSSKKCLEYLFWVWDPDMVEGKHDATNILEEGFPDSEYYLQRGHDGAVALTNSLILADRVRIKWIQQLTRARNSPHAEDCFPARAGQIIVTKVYIGKNVCCHDTKQINRAFYPEVDSVFRPKKNDEKFLRNSSALGQVNTVTPCSQTLCDCANRQSEWFVFDNQLVMPEYVVDFEYITKVKATNPFLSSAVPLPKRFPVATQQQQFSDMPDDTDVLNMQPPPKPRPRLIVITDEILLKVSKMPDLSSITTLNLHGNGLTQLRQLHVLLNLKRLTVSFNEISKLDELSGMMLEHLDAGYNRISGLDGFKNMTVLKYLDVSSNKLCRTREDISSLRKHCTSLSVLDLRHNRWHKPEGLRLRAIGRIKTLTKLNGYEVLEGETAAALRMAAGSRVSQVLLVSHARLDSAKPRSLSLNSIAKTLKSTSRNKPLKSLSTETHWYNRITSLCLDGMHISKLSNMEKLECLRWASFNDNDITKIEGLDSCRNIEELSLENNCISRIDGLQRLSNLRVLNLSRNFITAVDVSGLDRLTSLHYVSLQDNDITTLNGIQRLANLTEFYVGNNLLTNIRDIFFLKQLRHLTIVDLCGNPVLDEMENYRLYIVYHLQNLKALDGHAVTTSEATTARDTFGGRLTPDFIAERLGHANFGSVREIDVPNASIRYVDLVPSDLFLNLRSVNLEHNNLSTFGGLVHLVNLRILCLNHNHIESIFPKRSKRNDPYDNEAMTPVLSNLEVLHLAFNGIKDLVTLQVNRLISLKALFLQSNEIQKVEGLEGLQDLRELVLDRNKIKSIEETSFTSQWNLQELHIEENRIKELSSFSSLENLQRLYLGMNRLQDICELEKLEPLPQLVELSVVNNAVARRLLHRPMLVYRMPNLQIIDGISVSEEERTKAELYFMEQNVASMATTIETSLPGIGPYKTSIPVKVTNMQLNSPDRNWSNIAKDEETLALERRLKGSRGDPGPAGRTGQLPAGYTDRLKAHLYGQHSDYYDPRSGPGPYNYNAKR